jgi:glycosyltransferase involved in cell wall biosynthesis
MAKALGGLGQNVCSTSLVRRGQSLRDAIVLSTWSWEVFNVPERVALAISMRGARVLYCEMPSSKFKRKSGPQAEIASGISGFRAEYWGAKLNLFAACRNFQWRMVANQILERASALGLKEPIFMYSHIQFIEPLCEQMRAHGLPLVHICMDYPEPYQYAQIALSDRTLVIPETVGHKLKARFGEKILNIPQSIHLAGSMNGQHSVQATNERTSLPLKPPDRPLLGYLGPLYGRVNAAVLAELMRSHPEWQFVCFGGGGALGLDNVTDIEWASPAQLPSYVTAFDVGLMPYDCFDDKNLHCVPLKLLDYFNSGIPVVSTSVISLRDYGDLIYFGDTPQELSKAIALALQEPSSSPKREQRKAIARAHSTEALGEKLEEVLDFTKVRCS